jgi:hypothetical protein
VARAVDLDKRGEQMTTIQAITIDSFVGIEATDDGNHVVMGLNDIAAKSHIFALPKARAIELIGFLITALKNALMKSHNPESPTPAVVLEDSIVAGSTTQKVVSMTLQIAPHANLEFALTAEQAATLSGSLAIAAAKIGGSQPNLH